MNILDLLRKIKEKRITCPDCKGDGVFYDTTGSVKGVYGNYNKRFCYKCGGSGRLDKDGFFQMIKIKK